MSSERLADSSLPPDDHSADDSEQSLALRNQLLDELRAKIIGKLQELVRNPKAKLHYSIPRFAKLVVVLYGYRLMGWPSHIPFRNFGNITGGNAALCELLDLWDQSEGGIRFERATPEDIASARRDPKTVHPSHPTRSPPVRVSKETAPPAPTPPALTQSAQTEPLIVPSLVLHPDGSSIVGTHLTCTKPSASTQLPARQRKQRDDTGKRRHCNLVGPYKRLRVLSRRGIRSSASVLEPGPSSELEPEDGRYWLVDDPVGEFVPAPQ